MQHASHRICLYRIDNCRRRRGRRVVWVVVHDEALGEDRQRKLNDYHEWRRQVKRDFADRVDWNTGDSRAALFGDDDDGSRFILDMSFVTAPETE